MNGVEPTTHWRLPLRGRLIPVVLAMAILPGGCRQPIGVERIDDDQYFRVASRSALSHSRPTEFSLRCLRNRKLEDDFNGRPVEVLETLQDEFRAAPNRQMAFVIAELAYLAAKPYPDRAPRGAFLHMSSLMYAYAYLFEDDLGPNINYYNPRFRIGCDLYNRSLAKLIRHAETRDLPWGEPFSINSLAGEVIMDDGERVMELPPNSFHAFKTVYEFKVRGIENVYRTPGIGVPLILLRKQPPPEEQLPYDQFFQKQTDQIWVGSGVVRFAGSVLDDPPYSANYALYDPLKVETIQVGYRTVPLETDLTTPLAYSIQQSPPPPGIQGMLNAEAWEDIRGLYLTEPYDPAKIPVVFVHGLMSSPMTWLKAMNELYGDSGLRAHYQVWYFRYPTGNPIVYSATVLRESLREAREVFDPDGDDPAFNDMVLVGHSMGGLLSRLVVTGADGELWDALSSKPLDELDIPDEVRTYIREVFYFEPLPFIKRVIFVATPHRGSELAAHLAGLASSVIKLPGQVAYAGTVMLRELQRSGAARDQSAMRMGTSVDDLSPRSLDMQFIASRQIPSSVVYHSIIADGKQAGATGGTDTVVGYDSAHLDGAASELIVKGTHACTTDPLVIREIERILFLHAEVHDSRLNAKRSAVDDPSAESDAAD